MDIIKDFISTPVIGMNFDTIRKMRRRKWKIKHIAVTEGTNVLVKLTPKDMIT